ncbi:hypothetical protein [Rhodopirellula sallentina]|uniref:Uncharacterized protein n=1 Tax=Rhodopirellula sallentina SM41 TaxID=1263870 RepID=M5U0F5_9BACT|nr:hypothetical protein [Rhodopirellula sallentina]EMI54724.1 hypothetical protein RSSM_03840 [Rhodopirellula sallentina SM41]
MFDPSQWPDKSESHESSQGDAFFDEMKELYGDDSHGPHFADETIHNGVELEELIRGAGRYVRPGDQLRARILERVSHRRERRRIWQRVLGGFTLSCTIALALIIIGRSAMTFMPRGPSSSDLHSQATRRANADGVAWEWALTEVVYDWRRSAATNLSRATPAPQTSATNQPESDRPSVPTSRTHRDGSLR